MLVEKDIPLTGDSLTNAEARQSQTDNSAEVNFQFDAQGARDLENLTGKNVGRRMAIVLDDNVVMAPTIQDKIAGGSGRITLGRKGTLDERLKEAQMLSLALKSGALPAPVSIGETRRPRRDRGEGGATRRRRRHPLMGPAVRARRPGHLLPGRQPQQVVHRPRSRCPGRS